MSNETQIKVIVTGKVQGVYYREETRKAAVGLGVKGYVKNLANGRVEAVFKGYEHQVKKMIEWCHNGSPAAMVQNVSTEENDPVENYETFEIRY